MSLSVYAEQPWEIPLFGDCKMFLPARWGQFGNSTRRMGADTVKHIAEIFKQVNLTQLTTDNKAVDNNRSFGTGVTSGKPEKAKEWRAKLPQTEAVEE